MRRSLRWPALVASVAIGLWVYASPQLLGLSDGARLSHIIVGPTAATFATVAMSGATRLVVRANVLLGAGLALTPLLFDYGGWWIEAVLAGLALAGLALVPTGRGHRYGGGWTALVGHPAEAPEGAGHRAN